MQFYLIMSLFRFCCLSCINVGCVGVFDFHLDVKSQICASLGQSLLIYTVSGKKVALHFCL